MSDISFRRINGRIVPIKNAIGKAKDVKKIAQSTTKKDIANLATVGAGFGVAGAGGYYGGSMIKKSWNAYRTSAHIRGSIKEILSIKKGMKVNALYKEASAFKVAGKALANRGFGLLAVSGLVGSSLAGLGAYKYLNKKTDDTTAFSVASTAGAIASGAGLALFAKKAKISHIVSALKATGKTHVSDISKAWSSYGEARTRKTINKYASMANSGTKKQEYSHNISKTVEQLKKVARKKSQNVDGQLKLF